MNTNIQENSQISISVPFKDKDLARETGNFLILNIQTYSPLKIVDDHEEVVSLNKFDKIINNLKIKKAPGTESTTN